MLLDRLRMRLAGELRMLGVAIVCVWPVVTAMAQPAPGVAPAPAASELTPAERAKRDGDKVFHWILIHGEKPRKPAASLKDEKPVAAKDDRAVAASRARAAVRPAAVDEQALDKPAAPALAVAPTAAAPAQQVAAPPVEAEAEPAPAPSALPVSTSPVAPPVEDEAAEPLKLVSQVEPKFPPSLLRTLRTGQVKVRFTVSPEGMVVEPAVVASSNSRLNSAALAAITQWRFAPMRKAQSGVVDLAFNVGE
jgi:TonB family protein